MSSRTFAPALILCVASVCALTAACAGTRTTRQAAAAEAPPPVEAPPPAPEAAAADRARGLPPPDAAEVGRAVERVFKGALTTGPTPSFAVGDFNGDDSQDLAVALAAVPG